MIHLRRALGLLLICALASCTGTTGGDLLNDMPFQTGGVQRNTVPDAPYVFTTPLGWTVSLTQATIVTGPFYFNDTAVPTGQFRGGLVITEVTGQVAIDALDPTLHTAPYTVSGETGTAVTVEIDLFPPDPTQSFETRTALNTTSQAAVSGTATPPAWKPSTVYSIGAVVTNADAWYVCTRSQQDSTSASSGGPTGDETSIADGNVTWKNAVPPAWTPATPYAVGDVVTNGGQSYVCVGVGGAALSANSGGPTGTGTAIHDPPGSADFVAWTFVPLPSVPFAGFLTVDSSLATLKEPLPELQRIAGAACDLQFTSSNQTLQFRVDPAHWFDLTDFSPFAESPLDVTQYSMNGGSFTWTNHSSFHGQLFEGVLGTSGVYQFELTVP